MNRPGWDPPDVHSPLVRFGALATWAALLAVTLLTVLALLGLLLYWFVSGIDHIG